MTMPGPAEDVTVTFTVHWKTWHSLKSHAVKQSVLLQGGNELSQRPKGYVLTIAPHTGFVIINTGRDTLIHYE